MPQTPLAYIHQGPGMLQCVLFALIPWHVLGACHCPITAVA